MYKLRRQATARTTNERRKITFAVSAAFINSFSPKPSLLFSFLWRSGDDPAAESEAGRGTATAKLTINPYPRPVVKNSFSFAACCAVMPGTAAWNSRAELRWWPITDPRHPPPERTKEKRKPQERGAANGRPVFRRGGGRGGAGRQLREQRRPNRVSWTTKEGVPRRVCYCQASPQTSAR